MPIVAVAFLLAACAGAATVSNSKDKAAPVGAVQLNGGTNAGDTSDITNRPNPPVHKQGTVAVKPSPAAAQPQTVPVPAAPVTGTAFDRCGPGIGIGPAASTAAAIGKQLPKPMCLVE